MATVSPTQDTADVSGVISWTPVTNADTAAVAFFHGGLALVEVTGTFNACSVQMQYGSVSSTLSDIDTDEHPDGAKFTTAGVTLLNLPRGYLKPTFTGGGGSQSLTVKVIPVTKKA